MNLTATHYRELSEKYTIKIFLINMNMSSFRLLANFSSCSCKTELHPLFIQRPFSTTRGHLHSPAHEPTPISIFKTSNRDFLRC